MIILLTTYFVVDHLQICKCYNPCLPVEVYIVKGILLGKIFQGSEEIFSVDPLPPKTSSVDEAAHSVSYVTHSVPDRDMPSDRENLDTGDRDEEELMPVDIEEDVS